MAYAEKTSVSVAKSKEDTEELAKYKTAEEDGRLVVLPVKYGDILYYIYQGEIYEFEVSYFCVHNRNRVEIHLFGTPGYALCTYNGVFDEDWYLTREEAEKAIAIVEKGGLI